MQASGLVSKSSMAFVFIQELQPGARKSDKIRTLIRKQAMKQVAAKRIEMGKQGRRERTRLSRLWIAASAARDAGCPYYDRSVHQSYQAQAPDVESGLEARRSLKGILPLVRSTVSIQGTERIILQYDVKLDKYDQAFLRS